jgi:hypothetical protein
MKNPKTTNASRFDEPSSTIRHPSSIPLLLAAMCGLVAMGTANVAPANDLNPHVAPPNSRPHGKSYAEWSARWFQWANSLETTHSPLFDTADCSTGQKGMSGLSALVTSALP